MFYLKKINEDKVIGLSIAFAAIIAFISLFALNPSKSDNPKVSGTVEYDDGFVSDYSIGEENLNGNTCENLKTGAIVAKQGSWLYYCGNEGLYKTNEDTKETQTILSGSLVTDIAVYKDYVYFVLWDGFAEGVFRIRTDGMYMEKVSDAENYFFYQEYIYFSEATPTGLSSSDYSIVRKHTDSIDEAETIYNLDSGEALSGVYNGYVIISGNEEVTLYNIASKQFETYAWQDVSYYDMHFDENSLICINDNTASIFNLDTKEVTEEKFYNKLNLGNINNGRYYFTYYTGGNYYLNPGTDVLGYTYPYLIDGENTKLKELDTGDILKYITIIDDWIYYAGAAGSSMEIGEIVRIDTNGENFEVIWERD